MHTLNYLSHSYDSVRGRTDQHVAEVHAQNRSSRPRRAGGAAARTSIVVAALVLSVILVLLFGSF